MNLCFFEDNRGIAFQPLTLTRPVDDLRLGILTIREKWLQALQPAVFFRMLRPALRDVFPNPDPLPSGDTLWLNSRYLPNPSLVARLRDLNTGTCIRSGQTLIAARVDGDQSTRWVEAGQPDPSNLLVMEAPSQPCITQPWDLLSLNGDAITDDIQRLSPPLCDPDAHADVLFRNADRIYIAPDATLEPGATLIAQDGPIYIGPDAVVGAGALIRGPVAVCEGATVKAGAIIEDATSIGPVCKAGGEVEKSILHSYSNKAHGGFMGHSLIGEWCNLGADTNTSDLKNNYNTVRISDWHTGDDVDTGQQFLGTIMGDHTKTAINTQLNTGSMIGVCCNVFSNGFPPTRIPSFSWVGANVIQPYRFDKALEAITAMMNRRDRTPGEAEATLLKRIFDNEHGRRR